MRIIFLDFDGVLVPLVDENKKLRPARASSDAIEMLNLLVESSNAKLVVSSSWKAHKDVRELASMLKTWGVKGEVLDKTPTINSGLRGEEIVAWLAGRFDVDSFVILDDEVKTMYPLEERLVRTSGIRGLTWENVVEATRILEPNEQDHLLGF